MRPRLQQISALAALQETGVVISPLPAAGRRGSFLLARQDRLAEAAEEWRFIIGWSEERGNTITADWPRREVQRLEARLAGG